MVLPESTPGPPKRDEVSPLPDLPSRIPGAPAPAEAERTRITEKELPEPPFVERPLPPLSVKGTESPAPQVVKKEENAEVVLLNPAVSEDAQVIQTRLSELGFYKGPIDGIWGRGSRAALTAFIEKNGLGSSERWDKKVQDDLFRKTDVTGQPPPEDSKDPISTGTIVLDISLGEDAKKIQSRLADLGLYKGPIDGIWGSGSRAGLRLFKRDHSLKNPEKWDKETQIFLFRRSNP